MSADVVRSFLNCFAAWRHDGLTPLISIKGYSDLLLDGAAGSLSDEQRQFVETIRQCSVQAIDRWNVPAHYLNLRYGETIMPWKEVRVSEAVDQALCDLSRYADIRGVQVEIPEDLPTVRANDWLRTVIAYLIEPWAKRPRAVDLPVTIRATLADPPAVVLQIRTGTILSAEDVLEPPGRFFPGTRLGVAEQIVQRYGSALSSRPVVKGTEFEFALPLWQIPSGMPLVVTLTEEDNGASVDLLHGQELVVILRNVVGPWRIAELNAAILGQSGSDWDEGLAPEEAHLRLHFWTVSAGETPLRISYQDARSPQPSTFAVQVAVR